MNELHPHSEAKLSAEPKQQSYPIGVRGCGVFLIVVGLFTGYFGIIRPLIAARHHAEHLAYGTKLILITPAVLLHGLLLLSFGSRGRLWIQNPTTQRPTAIGWAFLVFTFLVGCGVLYGLRTAISSYGY